MSFGQSISHVLGNMTNFSGRASRSEYWWWVLAIFILQVIASILDGLLGTGSDSTFVGIISMLVGVVVFLASLAVTFRRLHDSGKSGWFILLALIPIVGAIVLLVFYLLPSEGPNRWGAGPATA